MSPASSRLQSIDLLRGLIMVIMAVDHCSALVSKVHFSEFWGVSLIPYHNETWLFTRLITHFCAPGFVMIMGMGMMFFSLSRARKGWSGPKIKKYFLKRGLIIMTIPMILEGPAWGLSSIFADASTHMNHAMPGALTIFYWACPVLFTLGMSMIICSFLLKTHHIILGVISLVGILASSYIIGSVVDPTIAYNGLISMLMIPGNQEHVFVLYPVLPWLSITIIGILIARLINKQGKRAFKLIMIMGIILVTVFIVLRSLNYGNFQINKYSSLIEFFTLIKYPPSLVFICFTIGINLLLLSFFSFIRPISDRHPLIIFGRTALFFYVVHLYIYALIGLAFPGGTSITILYLMWFVGIIPLYFLCKWYLKFKKSTPENSLWRLF